MAGVILDPEPYTLNPFFHCLLTPSKARVAAPYAQMLPEVYVYTVFLGGGEGGRVGVVGLRFKV